MNIFRKAVQQFLTAGTVSRPEPTKSPAKNVSRKDVLMLMAQDKLSPAQAKAIIAGKR
ncbi:MAG TPA: hypothetical protein VNN09_05465 [Candidatus Competibacteraceae bacterium]|nr:hypothetical protein [Candidatus Competibacteraceae bacterium]